ncbi:MAG: relaxase domain-containing protein [Phycisphaerae bacterium]|nr:relaxase domain-containing protein [Phycisphaerae bacterium]
MGRKEPPLILILVLLILSICKLGKGQHRYYLNLAAEDYYIGGGEPNGLWIPTAGAKCLRLKATVARKDLHNLFHGLDPDGKQLVQNANRAKRRPGYDLTFSAPKTLSVLWAMAPPDVRQAIQQCQFEAVTEAIRYLEQDAAFCRRGKGGCEFVSAYIVAAAFEHGTSRTGDCNLHTHAVLVNLAFRPDGSTGALESKPFYEHKMVAGAVYRAHLAHLLQERLGLKIVRRGDLFEAAGVPQELCDYFSQRRQQILKRLADKGLDTAAAAALAAIETRQSKTAVPPRSELFAQWQQIGQAFGFAAEQVRQLLHQAQSISTPQQAMRIVKDTINSVTQTLPSFDRKTLQRHALSMAVESGVHPAAIHRAIDDRLDHSTAIYRVAGPENAPRYTTAHAMSLRTDIAQSVHRMISTPPRPLSTKTVEAVIAHYSKPREPILEEFKHHLNQIARAAAREDTTPVNRPRLTRHAERTLADQDKTAIRRLTAGTSRISTLQTTSVTDRHLTLAACRQAYEKAGLHVIGTSLSTAAASRLQEETGIESMSLRRLELKLQPTLAFRLRHHTRQMVRAAQHKPTYALERLKITKDTVLVVDGAQRLTAEQLANLTRLVAKQGGRLILVEDKSPTAVRHASTPFHEVCQCVEHRPEQPPSPSKAIVRDNHIVHNPAISDERRP